MDGLSVEQNLNKAKSLVRKGKSLEALNLYNAIIKKFPHNKRAQLGIEQLKPVKSQKTNPSQQDIDNLVESYQTGQYAEAENLAQLMTQDFPENPFGWKVLGAVLKETGRVNESLIPFQKSLEITPQDPTAYNNLGVTLQQLGRLEEAETFLRQAIVLKFDYAIAHNNLGITLNALGRLKEAEASLKQAINLKSDYVEVYANLGNTLKKLNKLDEARVSYTKLIQLRPDYIEGYKNLGVILREMGKLSESEERFRQVIALKPDDVETYNNFGNTLQEMGKFEEAIDSYEKAIKLRPNYLEAQENLISCLTFFTPKNRISNSISVLNEKIKQELIRPDHKGKISDNSVIKLISKSLNLIKDHKLNFATKETQIYRRNTSNLNCKRHMSIFRQHNIIPEFCFGCYKVQIEPSNMLDLVKLITIFDELKLEDNNTRKCMVELRPEISGSYKGLIYCSNLVQANKIAIITDRIVKQKISSKLTAKVKRGCSEYPISFPNYKEINNNGPQIMNYNKDWVHIEEAYDKENPHFKEKNIYESITGLNLQDVLIIRNWIDYAKGIGDTSINSFNVEGLKNPFIYNNAIKRSS